MPGDAHQLAALERALRVTEEAYGPKSAEAAAMRAELAVRATAQAWTGALFGGKEQFSA